MLFDDRRQFSRARAVKLGRAELAPMFARLRTWIQNTLGVSVVHIELNRAKYSRNPRLDVILETDADYRSWTINIVECRPGIERQVISQLKKLAARAGKSAEVDGVYLCQHSFAEACIEQACSTFTKKDADRIIREFADVPIWEIRSFSRHIVIFLPTEANVRKRSKDGTCKRIKQHCLEAVKQYDEFGYVNGRSLRPWFDTRQNFDKKYKGNWYNYWSDGHGDRQRNPI